MATSGGQNHRVLEEARGRDVIEEERRGEERRREEKRKGEEKRGKGKEKR